MSGELEAKLQAAFEQVFGEFEGGIVTRWVVLVETVGPDGERGVWTETSRDLMKYEAIGLLRWAQVYEEAKVRVLSAEEDDGD